MQVNLNVLLVLIAMATRIGAEPSEFANGPTHAGVSVDIDLPILMHVKNAAGVDGAGLCVWASLQMASQWSSIKELDDLFEYMKTQKGGGWPERVERVLKVRSPLLSFVQVEDASPSLLDAAIRTGRPIAVTYGYGEFYGMQTIAHMVLLVHLDKDWAAIIDNNDPTNITWMKRPEFLKRWKHPSGKGWAVVLLAAPPPPVPSN